jgi:hypothetical protein
VPRFVGAHIPPRDVRHPFPRGGAVAPLSFGFGLSFLALLLRSSFRFRLCCLASPLLLSRGFLAFSFPLGIKQSSGFVLGLPLFRRKADEFRKLCQ